MPTKSFFLVKYLFRMLHMATFAFVFGDIVFNQLWGVRVVRSTDKSRYTLFYVSSCLVLLVSGLINMIILVKENKFIKNWAYSVWKNLLVVKFILTLSLTPLLEKVLPGLDDKLSDVSSYFKIRLSLVILMFLMSPFLRFYREYYLSKINIEGHQVNATGKVN